MRKQTKSTALSAFLVLAARTGDQKALSDLVRLQNPRMKSHAMRLLGDRDGATDCVQEAWIEIIRGLKRLRDPDVFLPWALRIVSRRVAREISRRQKTRALSKGLQEEAESLAPVKQPKLEDEFGVQAAIQALPGHQRACIALFYLEDMRVAEVAMALDVPVGTVKTRLMHARKKLHALLERKVDG